MRRTVEFHRRSRAALDARGRPMQGQSSCLTVPRSSAWLACEVDMPTAGERPVEPLVSRVRAPLRGIRTRLQGSGLPA